jgi:hypothetical protein
MAEARSFAPHPEASVGLRRERALSERIQRRKWFKLARGSRGVAVRQGGDV